MKTIWSGETKSGTEFAITHENGKFRVRCETFEINASILPGNVGSSRVVVPGTIEFPVTREEASEIKQLLTEAQADSPEALRNRRDMLANRIGGLHDEIARRQEQAWERGDERGGVTSDAELTEKLEDARGELAAFDAEHPEVLESIERAKEEAVERAMWR